MPVVIIRPSVSPPRLFGGTVSHVIPDNSRWVFLGDSIVDAQLYTSYVESYFHLRYPSYSWHFRGEGRGGAQITDATTDGRYDRRVYGWRPTIVSEMFGHNGAPSDAQYLDQLTDLVDTYIVGKSGATPILWGPHPTNTSTGKPSLGGYSDQVVALGAARSYAYADIWHSMQPLVALNLGFGSPADLQGFDTVHWGPSGHFWIAYTLLTQMGAIAEVSNVRIDATGPTLINAVHARVSGLTANAFSGVDFIRTDDRLPMAVDDAAWAINALLPSVTGQRLDINRYLLQVTNLASGTYDVYIDGVNSGSVSHSTLASTNYWNMSAMTAGPIHAQLQEVLGRIRDKEGVSRIKNVDSNTFEDILPRVGVAKYKSNADAFYDDGNGLTGEALADALAPNRAEVDALDALIKAAAQPVARTFSLQKQ